MNKNGSKHKFPKHPSVGAEKMTQEMWPMLFSNFLKKWNGFSVLMDNLNMNKYKK